MVRDELDPESSHAYIGRNADHVIELLHQPTGTDMTTGDQLTVSDDTQRTVRLDREGELVTRLLSDPDGGWQPIDQRRIDLEDTVYVGLAACSTVPGETSTATFEDVVVERLDER
jgi:regulation of enolase protein 1 (concanavalin A-like superfamily)